MPTANKTTDTETLTLTRQMRYYLNSVIYNKVSNKTNANFTWTIIRVNFYLDNDT